MASELATILLTLVGIGVIVVGVLILIHRVPEERVVVRPRGHWGHTRPIMY